MAEKILVCLNQSQLDKEVLHYAAASARKTDRRLVLLNVCRKDFASFSLPAAGEMTPVPVNLVIREFIARLAQTKGYLQRIVAGLAQDGIEAETAVVEGSGTVAETIAEIAEDPEIGEIVLGSHGRRGLMRFIMGSISASIYRKARKPVFIVRAGEGDLSQVHASWWQAVPRAGELSDCIDTLLETDSTSLSS